MSRSATLNTDPAVAPKRRGRPPGPLVVYRLPADRRLDYLNDYVGLDVALTVNHLRDTKAPVRTLSYLAHPAGELYGRVRFHARVVAVALTNIGTVDHVLVVQARTVAGWSRPVALSGATVETIDRVTDLPAQP